MTKKKSGTQPPSSRLRERAEARLVGSAGQVAKEPARTAEDLVHELQVHQIELEIQNEELRQARLDLEASRDRYADLYDFAPVGYFTFNPDGLIIEVNLTGAELLGVARGNLIRRNFRGFVDFVHRDRWESHVAHVLQSVEKHSCELTVRRPDGSLISARLDSVRRAMSGEPEPVYAIRTALFDITELEKAERERMAHAERLNELTQRLAGVQEAERTRLSGELHDRTSSNLAALGLNLSTIAQALPAPLSPVLEALLEDTRALVNDTTASIREICAELRPPVLDYAGLLGALERHVQQFGRRTGIAVSVERTQLRTRPSHEHELLLFRIVSEALANCAKHARAKSIRIALANEGQRVVLTITDDGVGFDEGGLLRSGKPRGLGLVTMRECAELAGGSFHVESGPGRGTKIEVRV
jgi:PAS domain S-box-containing protein